MFDTLILCATLVHTRAATDTLVFCSDSLIFLNREALVVQHTERREAGKTYYFNVRSQNRESGRWYTERGSLTVLPERVLFNFEDRPLKRAIILKRKPRRK